MSKSKKILPELRFPEFKDSGEWDVKTLGEVLIKNSKKNKNQKYSLVESVSNKFGFIKQDEYFENRRVASKDTSNYYVIKKGYFAYNPSRIDVGSLAYKHNEEISIISPLYVSFKANNELIDDYFLLSFFNSVNFTKQMIFEGGVRNTLNYDNLIQIKIPISTIQEQQKIASCLSSLDEVIEANSKKLELLKDYKKGLLQNLFPQEGEKVPKLRFKEFEKDGEWGIKKIEDVLDYERPDDYIVSDTDYQEVGTPVLTANKSFILGYTQEDFGIYKKIPAIIFDDFTVDTKYVDFPFKVKSSAIKILTPKKKDNLKFIYELLSQIIFDAKEHKRYYISEYQQIELPFPSLPEQQKIASCLSFIDKTIEAQAENVEQLKLHKQGLIQGLFPKISDCIL